MDDQIPGQLELPIPRLSQSDVYRAWCASVRADQEAWLAEDLADLAVLRGEE
jgi:hypothetical protein